jgi:ribosomal protein L37E
MTTKVRERTYQEAVRTRGGSITIHFGKRHSWTPCPRCIGGNIYLEYTSEQVCIQCGYSLSPRTHKPSVRE